MTVHLEATIRRYIGLSTDIKPGSAPDSVDGIPAGSSYLETDTGLIYRHNGTDWAVAVPSEEQATLLTAILEELRDIRATVGVLVSAAT